jgi:hypothetical protein
MDTLPFIQDKKMNLRTSTVGRGIAQGEENREPAPHGSRLPPGHLPKRHPIHSGSKTKALKIRFNCSPAENDPD